MGELTFYLGAHHPHWLALAGVPLFVSRNALARYKTLPRAIATWALDSGGFTELSMHGEWRMGASAYAGQVRRYRDEIGQLAWAAPQDWMCEPDMLKRTGLSVEQHQQLTVENFPELSALAPDLPWIPVLQGWCAGDYLDHAEAYERAGVKLAGLPLVGVGSVCRRQSTVRISLLFSELAREGLRLHGFGVKLQGLRASVQDLVSADSMAWSSSGRRNPPMTGHTHKNCANCMPYAFNWRADVLATIEGR